MIPYITTAVALLIFVAFAIHQAREDKGGKPAAQHAPDWQGRATFGLAVSLACAGALSMWTDKGFLWAVLGFGLIGYGAFTPVFRWRLNRLRGMDARYVSGSNAYDLVFMSISWLTLEGSWVPPFGSMRLYGSRGYYNGPQYAGNSIGAAWRIMTHRSGFIAYAVELTALLIGGGITLAH
jgi:hypothetical protein